MPYRSAAAPVADLVVRVGRYSPRAVNVASGLALAAVFLWCAWGFSAYRIACDHPGGRAPVGVCSVSRITRLGYEGGTMTFAAAIDGCSHSPAIVELEPDPPPGSHAWAFEGFEPALYLAPVANPGSLRRLASRFEPLHEGGPECTPTAGHAPLHASTFLLNRASAWRMALGAAFVGVIAALAGMHRRRSTVLRVDPSKRELCWESEGQPRRALPLEKVLELDIDTDETQSQLVAVTEVERVPIARGPIPLLDAAREALEPRLGG